MRKKILTIASALVLSLATYGAGAPATSQEVRTASADVSVLAQSGLEASSSKHVVGRDLDDLRDSVALVLVGSMLIGLAAAVRRTA